MENPEATNCSSNGDIAIVFSNFLLQSQSIVGFRGDVLFLSENGKEQLVSRAKAQFYQVKEAVDGGKIPADLEKTLSNAFNAALLMKNPDAIIEQSQKRIDAASVVFMHSLLDATLFSLCLISHDVNPNDWLGFVKERQLKIGDVLANGQDAAMKIVSRDYVSSLERESVIKKSDKLHAICKPPTDANYASNYAFSRDALESFDKLRHDIVHGLKFGAEIPKVEEKLDFALKTGVYFSRMVGEKYKLGLEISKEQYHRIFPLG